MCHNLHVYGMQYLHDDQQDTIGIDMLFVRGVNLVGDGWEGGHWAEAGGGAAVVSRETVVAAAWCPADMTLPSITTKHTLIFHF